MTNKELIGYAEIHCRTDLAMFAGEHIKRLYALAGEPAPMISDNGFYSAYCWVIDPLVAAARARLTPEQMKSDLAP